MLRRTLDEELPLKLLLSITRTGPGISADLSTSPQRADYPIILFRGATPLVSTPSDFSAWLGIDSFELSTDFGSCSRAITRSSYRSIVLRSVLGILAQEDAENRVVPEDVSVVVRVPTDSHRRCRTRLLEGYTRERDNVLILGKLKQHRVHGRVTLHNVRQTIERRVVQYISNNVRVDDSAVLVVYERPCVDRYQRLNCRAKVVRRQVRAVGQLRVYQRVNRNRRVRCNLDQRVEGEGKPVVEFVGQTLEQTRIIDCYIQREVGRVDEVGVLPDCCNDLGA